LKKIISFLLVFSFLLVNLKTTCEAASNQLTINQPTYVYQTYSFKSKIVGDIKPKVKVVILQRGNAKIGTEWTKVKFMDQFGRYQQGWINQIGTMRKIEKPTTLYSVPMKTNSKLNKITPTIGVFYIVGYSMTGWYKVLYNSKTYFIPDWQRTVTLDVDTMSYDDPISMNGTGLVRKGISYSILDEKPGNWYKIAVNKKNVWVQKVKKPRTNDNAVFNQAVNTVLTLEGKGFSDHPSDKGGKTRYGITQAVYDHYRDKIKLPHQSVNAISTNEVKDIYRNSYYKDVHASEMSPKLATVMLDTAVNFGDGNAYVIFQRALGIVGKEAQALNWGELTDYSFNNLAVSQENELAKRIIFERMRSRYNIVNKDKTQSSFLKGWLERDKQLKTTLSL